MIVKSIHLRFLLLLVGLATACVDEIDLPAAEGNLEKLVIQGKLMLGTPSRVEVNISRTADFRASATPETVDGAAVTLAGDEGSRFALIPAGKGNYFLDMAAGIAVGRSYQLQVQLQDGNIYESTWEPLLPVPAPDSLSYRVIVREELNSSGNIDDVPYVQFFATTPVRVPGAEDKSNLRWDCEGIFILPETPPPPGPQIWIRCYATQPLNLDEITLFEGAEANGDLLLDHLLFEEKIDHRFNLGYYLTAYQQSLSPGAFTYLDQVNTVVRRNGGLFDVPVGPINSNLHNVDRPDEEVLGYFYAVAVDTIRRRIDIPFELRPPYLCDPVFADPDFSFCSDCLLWPRSFLEKPDYWED